MAQRGAHRSSTPGASARGAPRGPQKRKLRGRMCGLASVVAGARAVVFDEAKREAKAGAKAEASRMTRVEVTAVMREEGVSEAAASAAVAHMAAARSLGKALASAGVA